MFKAILSKFHDNSDKEIEENHDEEHNKEIDYQIRFMFEHEILPIRINCEPIYIITSIIAEKGAFLNKYYHTLYAQNKMVSPYSIEEFIVYAPFELSGVNVVRIEMPKKYLEPNSCKRAYVIYNDNYTKHLYVTIENDDKMCMWVDGEYETIGQVNENELEMLEDVIKEEEIYEGKYTDILETLMGDTKKAEQIPTDDEEIMKHSQLFIQSLMYVQKLKDDNKREEASRLIKEIIKKESAKYEDTDLVEYHSFRNSFEALLYANLYHPYNAEKQEKKQGAPTIEDLSSAYLVYGIMMLEQKQYDKALDILWEGHRVNPVNVPILFALADAYKGKNYLKSYYSVIRNAHSCAVRKQDIARIYRCYAYYYAQIKDYDMAIALIYAAKCFDAQGFTNALREIEQLADKTFKEPIVEELKESLRQKNIPWGAKELTLGVISLLEKQFFQSQNQQGLKMCAELKKEVSFEN